MLLAAEILLMVAGLLNVRSPQLRFLLPLPGCEQSQLSVDIQQLARLVRFAVGGGKIKRIIIIVQSEKSISDRSFLLLSIAVIFRLNLCDQ